VSLVATGRPAAAQLAIGRMAVGVAGFMAPRTFGRIWIGEDARSPRIAMITRAFAIRDFALGLGAYLAIQKDAPRGRVSLVRKLALAGASLAGVAGGVLALQDTEVRASSDVAASA
jgi:hypothetical protein